MTGDSEMDFHCVASAGSGALAAPTMASGMAFFACLPFATSCDADVAASEAADAAVFLVVLRDS